jgi:HK97 family phage portal protein
MNPFKIFTRKKEKYINNSLLKTFTSGSNYITGSDPTAFAAVNLIASSFAALSGKFYSKGNKQEIKDYSLYDVLENPNFDENKFQFFFQSVKDYFDGNVYWFKVYNEDNLNSLFRLSPSTVKVKRDKISNRKIFTINGIGYDSETVTHIPSVFGYDGLVGKSIYKECSHVFTTSGEIDNYIRNNFNNSIGNRLVIDVSKAYPNITDEQINELKQKFIGSYASVKNAGVPLIKSKNIEYGTIETDFKDNRASQLIENRAFQEKEIAKLFGVPLPLLTGADTANIEPLFIIFIENAILPIAVQFEQAINKMIPLEDRHSVYFEYSYNSLLKTSLQTRIDTYTKQIQSGILTPNEARKKENLPEIDPEAGGLLFVQSSLLPLRKDVIDAYMANSKLKMEQLQNLENQHEKIGDDKQ